MSNQDNDEKARELVNLWLMRESDVDTAEKHISEALWQARDKAILECAAILEDEPVRGSALRAMRWLLSRPQP